MLIIMSIPKIIHQIWIGPNKKPDVWMNTFSKDYVKSNPEWKYILWDDENIYELFEEFPLMLKIYNIEPTYNGKSDLLRYLILYKYGGLYIDADSVWINKKSFNSLFKEIKESNIFFAYVNNEKKYICGGVMGSSKKNIYLLKIINNIKNMVKRKWKDNNIYLADYKRKARIHGAWRRIGPGLLSEMFLDDKKITIFPSIYFYPIYWLNNKNININHHENLELPKESYTFQYGYTTNGLQNKI